MKHQNNKNCSPQAMTLIEVVLAITIISIILAVLLPQLRLLQNNWDTKVGSSETLQNGRILIDHLNRNLSEAARITAVSEPSETNGYIEFIDNDANTLRYDVNSVSDYVEFGHIGSLSDLAGPVSRLQFFCYSNSDFSIPTTDVNAIRSVKIESTLKNSARLDQDMTFSTQVYIRTNTLPIPGGDITQMSEPWFEFDPAQGMEPALVNMSGNKYLCVYRGDRDDGWASILTVNNSDWSVSIDNSLEYDTKQGITPALAKIDDTNFLCAYQGDKDKGWACIIYESSPGLLAEGPKLEFDAEDCRDPVLSNIITQGDDHYFLCVYATSYGVRAIVLKATIVPSVMMLLDAPGTIVTFPAAFSPMPTLARIDDTHYLCAYQGQNGGVHGGAVILTINNPTTGSINAGTHFDFNGESAGRMELAKIDDTHYLCTHTSSNDGRATVLTVNPTTWTVTKDPGPDFPVAQLSTSTSALCRVNNTIFLFAYPELTSTGATVVLTVNAGDWSISKGTPCTFEMTKCLTTALCQIDSEHYLCAYNGFDSHGFIGVLELNARVFP
jgi:prepilin-type N-terminal cleavage/methylation domain-containing protein